MSELEKSVDFWVEELTKDTDPEHFGLNVNDFYYTAYKHNYSTWMWNRGYNAGLINLQTKINTYCILQWVSVKDRLPDNNLYVLVTYYDLGVKDYCISIGAYHAKENVWIDDTFTKIINVTAWMPLPKLFDEKEGQQ